VRIRAIQLLQLEYRIGVLCRVLRVSKSTYYYNINCKKEPSKRELQNKIICEKIIEIHKKTDKRYGAEKMKLQLAKDCMRVSTGRVSRLMTKMDLPKMSTIKPRKVKTQEKTDETLPNILDRRFDADYPNQKWVTDITYIRAEGRWYYLCAVMDLFSRKIVAYRISSRINAALVQDTIRAAYRARGCPQNVIFHSDRGRQYTAKETRRLLDEYNFTASFSRKGCPYDNAVVEAFFHFLKHEEVYRRNYATKKQMEVSVFGYIEGFYNTQRIHSAAGNQSPAEKEKQFSFSKDRACSGRPEQALSFVTV